MPAGYEKIRDKMVAEGKSLDYAKKHASMIWNSKPGHEHVGRGSR